MPKPQIPVDKNITAMPLPAPFPPIVAGVLARLRPETIKGSKTWSAKWGAPYYTKSKREMWREAAPFTGSAVEALRLLTKELVPAA